MKNKGQYDEEYQAWAQQTPEERQRDFDEYMIKEDAKKEWEEDRKWKRDNRIGIFLIIAGLLIPLLGIGRCLGPFYR